MLATMNTSQRDVPLREHSHLTLHKEGREALGDNVGLGVRMCPGCKQSAVSEHGGLVVAFGQSFFHVDCFKCAKCGDQMTADTNLLLLPDGSPICTKCSYSCNVCHLPILDEAIMTGDDAYHAHCFKCKVCKNSIDELVFAKTSQGIYCMNCHNERMIKIRRHAQKKAEREKAAGSSGSAKSRERDARNYHQENGTSSLVADTQPSSSKPHGLHSSHSSRPSSSRGIEAALSTRSAAKPPSGPYVSDAFESYKEIPPSTSALHLPQVKPPNPLPPLPHVASLSSKPSSMSVALPTGLDHSSSSPEPYPQGFDTSVEHDRPNPVKQSTYPSLHASTDVDPDGRRRSYDDGVRPLNVLFAQNAGAISPPEMVPPVSEGLQVATSKREKRRSINPGISLSDFNTLVSSPTFSARSTSSHGQRTPNPPTPGGHDSSCAPSPLREHFRSRPGSHDSSHLSHSSFRSSSSSQPDKYHSQDQTDGSQPPSPSRFTDDQAQDQTVVIKHSPPSSVTLDSAPPAKSRAKGMYERRPLPPIGRTQSQPQPPATSNLTDIDVLHIQRSFDNYQRRSSRPDSGSLSHHSLSRSGSVSPAHRADVPHNVESETDTEAEGEGTDQQAEARQSMAPAPPPKEGKDIVSGPQETSPVTSDVDPDASTISHQDSGSDVSESSPVEYTSQTTAFIAPAIPPIRFSMNTADFSELFSSLGGLASRKSYLTRISEDNDDPTPPPTAALEVNLTPTSNATIISPDTQEDSDGLIAVNGCGGTGISRRSESNSSDSSHELRPQTSSSSLQTSLDSETQTLQRSNGSTGGNTRITLTEAGSSIATTLRSDTSDIVMIRLQEALTDAKERGAQQLKMDRGFIEAILATLESRKADYEQMKNKFDGIKRTSKHYIEGLSVAQTEYDRELKFRRDAEAEVTRLKVLLSGQMARLTVLSGDSRREEIRQQLSKELNDSLSGLEFDLSKLKAERDVTLAEVEELSATKSSAANTPEPPSANLGRSLTKRLETIKTQYKRDLIPLTQQRETLTREIAELRAVRDVFLEETTVLSARNEELAQLSTAYSRRMENISETFTNNVNVSRELVDNGRTQAQSSILSTSISSSNSGSSTAHDDTVDLRYFKVPKQEADMHTPLKGKFRKWHGSKSKEVLSPAATADKKAQMEHNFQQLGGGLRVTRCDHCGEKMWGSLLRCTVCSTSIHIRCAGHIHTPCVQHQAFSAQPELPPIPLPPSMFGRDLTEQVRADSKGGERQVPVIVEKCIDAVEVLALDYEGIYRKSGGSSQSKAITQLFERGDYKTFDLRNSDRFNDICSVTSVLKNYFRALPVPLLTYDLHDQFMSAVQLKDPALKHTSLLELVNKLPNEHYYTLRLLMLHLNRVRDRCERNLMNARNLGVVFGPTLMRSPDPAAEFSDMAGKALSVEWLVENAPVIFNQNNSN